MKRPIAIRCLHPRLRWDRRAVVRAMRELERHRPELGAAGIGGGVRRGIRTLGAGLKGSPAPEPTGELSLVFMTDEALGRLHGTFLADPSLTDVITFPGPTPADGDEICVSVDAARRQKPRGNFSAELTLYLVHGWLHLAGHDDLSPVPRRAMRKAERAALAVLRRAEAIPPFSFQPSSTRS